MRVADVVPESEHPKPTWKQKVFYFLGINSVPAKAYMDAPWYPKSTYIVRTPEAHGLEYEDVRLPALDGCQIAAWYMPAKASNKLAVIGHQSWTPANKSGMPKNYKWDTGFPMLQIEIDYVKLAKVLHDWGFHVVSYDLRNHGESEHKLPSGYGEIEYQDVAGVMDWCNQHPVLKDCKILLMPFCVSGNSALKANSLYPDKFKNVACWATTNIFQGAKMTVENPAMAPMIYLPWVDKELATRQKMYEDKGLLKPNKDIKFKMERISAFKYAPDVKVPVLFCDPINDTFFNHADDAWRIAEAFPNCEFHNIGTDQPGLFKTATDNRCEGYTFYYQDGGKKVLQEFLKKNFPGFS